MVLLAAHRMVSVVVAVSMLQPALVTERKV
jgi:hypothetical protein